LVDHKCYREYTEVVFVARKEVSLEINADLSICSCLMTITQSNFTTQIVNKSFENVHSSNVGEQHEQTKLHT